MHYVYILFSDTDRRLYIGKTSDLKTRLKAHHAGYVKATSRRLPMKLIHFEGFVSSAEATRRERYLKGGNGRNELKKMLSMTLARLRYSRL